MNELVLSFLTWIAIETGLAIAPPPTILLIPAQEMHKKLGRHFGTVALYMRDTATVYLPVGWNSAALYDRATLLHELVHHMQEINRVPSQCNAERERQAYDLTRKWLSEQGVADPYALLNMDELTITILSSCPSPDGLLHPPTRGSSLARAEGRVSAQHFRKPSKGSAVEMLLQSVGALPWALW